MKPRSLFLTPRAPRGKRLPSHACQNPMRAAEDNPAVKQPKIDPRDRDILRKPGDVAPTVKQQLQRDIDWNRQRGYTSDRDLTLQQKYARDNLMRDTFQPKPAQPEAKAGWSLGGELNYGRTRPKDGPTEASAEFGATYGVPAVKDQSEDEEEKKKRTSPNGTGEEQKPRATR